MNFALVVPFVFCLYFYKAKFDENNTNVWQKYRQIRETLSPINRINRKYLLDTTKRKYYLLRYSTTTETTKSYSEVSETNSDTEASEERDYEIAAESDIEDNQKCIAYNKTRRDKEFRKMIRDINDISKGICEKSQNSTCKFIKIVRKLRNCLEASGYFDEHLKNGTDLMSSSSDLMNTQPTESETDTLRINVSLHLQALDSVSDLNMQYQVDILLQQKWFAAKSHCIHYVKLLCARNETLVVNEKYKMSPERVWIPDTFVMNAKVTQYPSEVRRNEKLYLSINDNGHCWLLYSKRLIGTIACEMDLLDYPIDSQKCAIKLRSFAKFDKEIQYFWDTATKEDDILTLEHYIKTSTSSDIESLFGFNFSVAVYNITFQRRITNKVAGVYFPSIMLVLTSFTTFWYGVNTTPERTTVGASLILALATMFAETRALLPPTSDVNDLDKWMVVCMLFVSLSMLEGTAVDYIYDKHKLLVNHPHKDTRKHKNDRGHRSDSNADDYMSPIEKLFQRMFDTKASKDMPEYTPLKIDVYSMYLFPLFFLIFCFIYWPYLLTKADF